MPQKARLRAIERFQADGESATALVATDVAARGLDIPEVDLVVHYHVPHAADIYVHRSGRTARADKSGQSILLCAPEEDQGVRRLVAKVHARNALESQEKASKFFIKTLDLDRQMISRLKRRVALAKKIADSGIAKEKRNHEDSWMRSAAKELGMDYDSDELVAGSGKSKGRGSGRKRREKEASSLSKDELGVLRAELRQELGKRINVGMSERYLTAGGIDVEGLVNGGKGQFLGQVETLS